MKRELRGYNTHNLAFVPRPDPAKLSNPGSPHPQYLKSRNDLIYFHHTIRSVHHHFPTFAPPFFYIHIYLLFHEEPAKKLSLTKLSH